MPGASKRQFAAAELASEAQAKYRFLPKTALPANLPDGPVAIADMAGAFGVTHRTLHFYEEKALISADRHGLMRIYGTEDVLRMAVITVCRETGMSIAVIQDVMERLDHAETPVEAETIFHDSLNARKRELAAEMSVLSAQMQKIADLLGHTGQSGLFQDENVISAPRFTQAERRCLELMASGQSTADIARTLALQAPEAEVLENAVIEKLGSHDRFQALAKAVLLGIVKP